MEPTETQAGALDTAAWAALEGTFAALRAPDAMVSARPKRSPVSPMRIW
jgi:hypothetical protein